MFFSPTDIPNIYEMSKAGGKASAISLLNELKKLKSQQKYLEAMQKALRPVTHAVDEAVDLNEVEKLKIEHELNWTGFRERVADDIEHAADLVKHFKADMMNEAALAKHPVKEYRERVQEIDCALRHAETKNISELRRAKAEHCEISGALASMYMTNLLINSPLSARGMINEPIRSDGVRAALSAPVNRSECSDVRHFDKFLNDHKGHTGGWLEEEHRAYIKMKYKYRKNIDQICESLSGLLVGSYRAPHSSHSLS